MNPLEQFHLEGQKNIKALGEDTEIQQGGLKLLYKDAKRNYSFNFDWLLRSIIQHSQDVVAFQEIVWRVKPGLIIEMGIDHGGSLFLRASLLALCDYGQLTLAPHSEHPR